MNQSPVPAITAIMLTFNEELHVARCLERLAPLADRIIVVDSFSTDRTVELARAGGAEVWQNVFVNHAAQFQWALDRLAGMARWIVRVDADEWFEAAAIAEIRARTAAAPDTVGAFEIRRKMIFRGRWIRWGGYYPTILTRIWRDGAAHVEQRWMDEHVVVDRGQVSRIESGDLVDENLKDITDWTDKHNRYTTLQMVEFINIEYPLIERKESNGLNRPAKIKRVLRNKIFASSPLYLRTFAYFFQRYFLRFGFLDGKQGLVFHFLHGFWNFFLMDAKIDEARRFIRSNGLDAFRRHLAQRHHINLPPS